jgi:hypothetical protein
MNHFKAACLISKVNWSSSEIVEIKTLLKELINHEQQLDFFKYCYKWKLAPICYAHLRTDNLLAYFDDKVLQLFKEEYQKITDQNRKRNKEAVKILKAFSEQNIEVAILKGNYLAHSVYNEVGYKRMNDFDILVKRVNWDKIQSIYLSLGYIPLGFGWSGEKEKPAKFSHVGMSFISPDYSCIIGSQWGLKSPTTGYSIDINRAWETAEEFTFCDMPVKALSTEFNLLHLILHMGTYKCGIRDCMDIYNLARVKTVNNELLRAVIKESGAAEKAIFTLSLSNYCSKEFSEKFIESIGKKTRGFYKRRLNKRIETQLECGDFQASYNDYFQDIEKEVINFNLYPKFHKKIKFYFRIIGLIFFPSTDMTLKLNDQFHAPTVGNKIVSRIKAPYFSFALIAQEIGWKFTFLLFVKLFFDLLLSLKNYFIKKESYFDYLRNKGVDRSKIEKIVSNIQ